MSQEIAKGLVRAVIVKAAVAALLVSHAVGMAVAMAAPAPVTVVVVRHAESGSELTSVGRQRAALLVPTFRDLRFTHIFATHTLRARQTLEPLAAAQKLPIVQLPAPGSVLAGETVTDATSRQAAVLPIAGAVLKLPPGSVALVGANMDNIYAILNQLGVPAAASGQTCARGGLCVPCLTKACFPDDYDRVWFLVIEAGRARPLVMLETRYGAGWTPLRP